MNAYPQEYVTYIKASTTQMKQNARHGKNAEKFSRLTNKKTGRKKTIHITWLDCIPVRDHLATGL